MKKYLKKLNVKTALNACAKKTVSIHQEAAWQLHSQMRQACSSRLHARNCFQNQVKSICKKRRKKDKQKQREHSRK